jgi:hypothetical protein
VSIAGSAEFETWLKAQPREVCAAIAYRVAMRVLPLASLAQDDQDFWRVLALHSLRASLTAGVASMRPTSTVTDRARVISDAIHPAADLAHVAAKDATAGHCLDASRAAYAAVNAAYAALHATNTALEPANAAASAVLAAVGAADADGMDYAARAATSAAVHADTALHPPLLWAAEIAVPSRLSDVIANAERVSSYSTNLLRSGGPWTFWAEWYDRAIAGDPLPWDLQEKIALIPNDIWEAGPEAVAAEIEKIEAAFRLRERIAEMEADQARPEDARFGIGGNNPPVEIDDPEVGRQMIILWDSVSGLKEEVEADEPDAERVSKLNAAVRAALGALFSWCGRKLDLAIDTFVTEGIKFAFSLKGLGAIYLVVDPARVQAVLKAAEDWLQLLLR